MAISLALSVSTAELEQLHHTTDSPVALAREILLTEVGPDPLYHVCLCISALPEL